MINTHTTELHLRQRYKFTWETVTLSSRLFHKYWQKSKKEMTHTWNKELRNETANAGWKHLLSECLRALFTQVPKHHLNTLVSVLTCLTFCYWSIDMVNCLDNCVDDYNHLVTLNKRLQNRSEEDDGVLAVVSHIDLFIRAADYTRLLQQRAALLIVLRERQMFRWMYCD